MAKRVYLFSEGGRDDRSLLGGKGANLCEMTNLGLPVPFGFVMELRHPPVLSFSSAATRCPHCSNKSIASPLIWLRNAWEQGSVSPENPLLFSVRSGAPVSMPGMMDTILNLSLNDEIVVGLAERTSNPRFAYDSYRRFIQMFGDVVLGVPGEKFEDVITRVQSSP